MTEKFAPTVLVDGNTVRLEGWMIILAFAINGIQWAVETARDPAFDLPGKIRDYNKRRSQTECDAMIEYYEKEIERLRLKRNAF